MKRKCKVVLTYEQIHLVYSLINLYCHGPIYRIYSGVLSDLEIKRNDKTAERLWKIYQPFRKEHRKRIPGWPQSEEARVALTGKCRLYLSQKDLVSVVKAFKITLAEAETSKFWHLKIILNVEPTAVYDCLHVLERSLNFPVAVELNDLHADAIPFNINESGELSVPEWFALDNNKIEALIE